MICDRGGQGVAGWPHGANRSGDEVLMVTVVCWVCARGGRVGRHQRPRPESSVARPYGGPSVGILFYRLKLYSLGLDVFYILKCVGNCIARCYWEMIQELEKVQKCT